jgi:hypothetical protein
MKTYYNMHIKCDTKLDSKEPNIIAGFSKKIV